MLDYDLYKVSKHWPLDFDQDVEESEIDKSRTAFRDSFRQHPAALTASMSSLNQSFIIDFDGIFSDGLQALAVMATGAIQQDPVSEAGFAHYTSV